MKEFQVAFDHCIHGFNGAAGLIEGVVNMGHVKPLQSKGHVPQYSQLDLLQSKFNKLEAQSIFCRPEDLKVVIEYLHPSLLVKKKNCGFHLVTAVIDVGWLIVQ